MKKSTKTILLLASVLAGTATTTWSQEAAKAKPAPEKPAAEKSAQASPDVQGEKIKDVKSVNNGTEAVSTEVKKGTTVDGVAQAVPGIVGASAGKMENLKKALSLTAPPVETPGGGSPGGTAPEMAVAKLLDKKMKAKEPEEPVQEVKDARAVPQAPPPNEAGGS